jgi:hypothetical protein
MDGLAVRSLAVISVDDGANKNQLFVVMASLT